MRLAAAFLALLSLASLVNGFPRIPTIGVINSRPAHLGGAGMRSMMKPALLFSSLFWPLPTAGTVLVLTAEVLSGVLELLYPQRHSVRLYLHPNVTRAVGSWALPCAQTIGVPKN